MFKKFLFILLATAPLAVFAQKESLFKKYLEIGPFLGFANYSGDLAQDRIELGETKVGYGFFVRRHQNKNFALRAHFLTGRISGTDLNSTDAIKERKLHFFSNLVEVGGQAEWLIFGKERVTLTGVHIVHATPYLFLGAAAAFSKPTVTQDPGGSALIVPLPEPGLKTAFFTTPIGVGGRFDILDKVVFGAEIGWRPAFSDDLDGVSANGNRARKDWYLIVGGSISYVLGNPYERKH